MKDPEGFIARWSRRKRGTLRETNTDPRLRRESATGCPPPPCGEGSGVGVGERGTIAPRPPDPPPGPSPTRGEEAAPGEGVALSGDISAELTFDPASLPPIDSITAETDIRGFLAPGVPSELTRAALHRAWVCDPKIRNFVGLADYDWDFNAADAVAGFGPLSMTEEIGNMVAQVVEPDRASTGARGATASATSTPQEIGDRVDSATEADNEAKVSPDEAMKSTDEISHRTQDFIATQDKNAKPAKPNAVAKPRHGGALPT